MDIFSDGIDVHGFRNGFIYTPWAIISNTTGGIDVTAAVVSEMGAASGKA